MWGVSGGLDGWHADCRLCLWVFYAGRAVGQSGGVTFGGIPGGFWHSGYGLRVCLAARGGSVQCAGRRDVVFDGTGFVRCGSVAGFIHHGRTLVLVRLPGLVWNRRCAYVSSCLDAAATIRRMVAAQPFRNIDFILSQLLAHRKCSIMIVPFYARKVLF